MVGLHAAGLTRLSDGPHAPGVTAAWVVAGLLFNDAWFYGWHRTLHHPALFRHVHVVHHRSVDVNPFTSYSFHVVEAVLLGLWIVPAAGGDARPLTTHVAYERSPVWSSLPSGYGPAIISMTLG